MVERSFNMFWLSPPTSGQAWSDLEMMVVKDFDELEVDQNLHSTQHYEKLHHLVEWGVYY
jgi:hypothetical protein